MKALAKQANNKSFKAALPVPYSGAWTDLGAAGALIPLNDLIEQYGSNITEMYGDVLNKSRYKDGQNYYLNNCTAWIRIRAGVSICGWIF